MLTSGFTNAPISKFLLFALVISSLLVSIADIKYLFYIRVVPHLWRYKQGWRLLVWQTCYTNSTEVLFATMLLYHLRVVERLWGSRKFASFLLSTLPYNTILPPMLLALVVRPLSFDRANYLPAGPTPIIFSLLAQYHAAIPHMYQFKVATSSSSGALLFSSKSFTYLLAFQLAFSSFPGSTLSALVGWCVGYAWRNEILPGASKWRIPAWLMKDKAQGQRFEGLRRRLEGEEAVAAASGAGGRDRGEGRQRRTLGTQILDQFRGNF
ncbi:hypothetical protein L228DRAFT_243570 [Xylona heveae TC161]|uniref:Peptidase S54 rhomboid domain-containing protein n=1 Tax=Xylona heveae (strain CBS 132557 / TC161) TaxID=1328760 RepID=A0A165IFW9_XYLHT|nr:hypothetical protein L228DRAFT_243570 [Xylona heveae TC161]KZF24840.1 hypothetical protein L228DRAFT_243570 [Xylona heveae TC161]